MKMLDSINPVFIDLETQSRVDLPTTGGWIYAEDASTRILTVSWSASSDHLGLWVLDPIDEKHVKSLIPDLTEFHTGPDIPQSLQNLTHRVWCAHNAWGFDSLVWRHKIDASAQPIDWVDTYPLSLAAGLPGGLDSIGNRLWGAGKYEEGSALTKKWSQKIGPVPPGPLGQIAKYNVQDVLLLRSLWSELLSTLRLTNHEWEVLQAHRQINERGVKVDRDLLRALIDLSAQCKVEALKEIKRLTGGFLSTQSDLQARTKVFAWLKSVGISAGDSLRKDIIRNWIDDFDDDDTEAGPDDTEETREYKLNLRTVIKVLELRSSAMRITDSKLTAALAAISDDNVARGLYIYWGAGPGRWAGRRIQTQNLPRPKKGIDVWHLTDLWALTGKLDFRDVLGTLDLHEDPLLTPDDAASALLRGLFIPHTDDKFLYAADLMQIEARMLAKLAGDEKQLDMFWNDEDPYIKMAERIYGRVWQEWPGVNGDKKKAKGHPWRQVGKVVYLGAGYQMSAKKLVLYALNQGIDLAESGTDAHTCIEAYRSSVPKIAGEVAGEYKGRVYRRGGIWGDMDAAMFRCIQDGTKEVVGLVEFERYQGHVYCRLPSGRYIVYRNAKIAPVEPAYLKGTGRTKDGIIYQSGKYGGRPETLYGGKIVQNANQGAARDVMAAGLTRVSAVLHVHDEEGVSAKDASGFSAFMSAITQEISWLHPFPLDAEGGILPRYAKSPPKSYPEEVWRNGRRHK